MNNNQGDNNWGDILVPGLCWGLVFAALDPVLCCVLRSSYVLHLSPGFLFFMEAVSLGVYFPPVFCVSFVLGALVFRRAKWRHQSIHFLLGAVLVWLVLMAFAQPMHTKNFLIYGSIMAIVAAAAGFGLMRLIGLLPSLCARRTMILALTGYCLAVADLNAGLAVLWAWKPVFALAAPFIIISCSLAFVVWLWLYRALLKGRGMTGALVLIALAFPAVLSPVVWRIDTTTTALEEAPSDAPHLIFIVADALREDSITPERTPNLWRLMEEGTYFSQAQATAPWTAPAMTGLFTARIPARFKYKKHFYRVPPEVPLIAEDLAARGYSTSAICANLLVYPATGLLRGFQELVLLKHMHRLGDLNLLPILAFIDHYLRRAIDITDVPDLNPKQTDMALARLKQAHDRPAYIYLHYMDPHDPYSPPPEFSPSGYKGIFTNPFTPRNGWHVSGDLADPQLADFREGLLRLKNPDKDFIRGLYLGEVAYLDRELGRLFDEIKGGIGPNGRPVLVVFTADHGEELFERGDFMHGHNLKQELLHVPLIFYGHGIPSKRINTPVSHVRVMPTLRELLGLAPDQGALQGSMAGMIRGEGEDASGLPCFSSETKFFNPRSALRLGNHKIIHDLYTGDFQHFDLATDPLELHPLDPGPSLEQKAEILLGIETLVKQSNYHSGKPHLKNDGIEQRMRAMGYIK